MRVSDLDTPALLIDLDIMERNLQRLADYTQKHELRLRPHTKTHKIPALGRKQLDLGAVGLTVAKVGEAEVMLAAEPADLLVAYPIIGRKKLERLMQVAKKTNLTVALDSLFAARQLSDAAREAQLHVGVLAEVDVGLGRVGVSPGEELIHLAQGIQRLQWLKFEGIAFYPGHIKDLEREGTKALSDLALLLANIHNDLRRAGLIVRVVSGGSTPTLFHTHELPYINEIRPGTYIFNDRNTAISGACSLEDCAASILTTVVSTAKKGQVLIDGGSKTFSSDRPAGSVETSFGHVVDAPETHFTKMNEEHGFIDIRRAKREFAVGETLRIIPNHVCVAMNLHERVYGIRGEEVEQVWTVEGRGKLQ